MPSLRNRAPWLALMALVACGSDGHVFPDGGYTRLSQTGLYADIGAKELAADSLPFSVAHVLWSDGAVKSRWLKLPAGRQIDTSDMDNWQLPVGGQLFKEFVRDGVRVETRLIERIDDTGDRDRDFWAGAFLWNDDESDARFVEDGAIDARGTDHDVPSALDCWRCHRGQPGSVLGLGAIQLSHSGEGTTLSDLEQMGALSDPPGRSFGPPGDADTARALGYLHANCAHCHNPQGLARPDTDMDLELSVTDASPEQTAIYRTTVGVRLQYWLEVQDQFEFRVVAGDPDASALAHRMAERTAEDAMPPLATEIIHPEGLAWVRTWIAGL